MVTAAAGTSPSRRGSCSSVVCHPYLGWAVTPRMWLQPWRVIDEDDKLLSAFPYIRKMAMMMDGCSCITETCSFQKSVPWRGDLWVAANVVCRLRVHVCIPIWAHTWCESINQWLASHFALLSFFYIGYVFFVDFSFAISIYRLALAQFKPSRITLDV